MAEAGWGIKTRWQYTRFNLQDPSSDKLHQSEYDAGGRGFNFDRNPIRCFTSQAWPNYSLWFGEQD